MPEENHPSRIRPVLIGLTLLFLFLSPSNALSQVVEAIDIRNAPPPGKLVDIGGRRLHINCTGKGSPTVVLEIGAGAFSLDWSLVQPEIAKFTRVCTYDRAGFAWSDLGPKPRTMRQIAFELHTALQKAGIKGPYVLAGHSLGGLIMRQYASQYPNEAAGMVLVDSTHEDTQLFLNNKIVRMRELSRSRPIPPVQTTMPAPTESPKVAQQPNAENSKVDAPFDKLPRDIQQLRLSAQVQSKSAEASRSEFDFLPEELAEMHIDRTKRDYPLGEIPLIVLAARRTGGTPPPGVSAEQWKQLNEDGKQQKEDLARLSRNSKLIIARNSGHEIHLDEPGLVIDAVLEVVEAIRHHTKLKTSTM